MIDCPGVILASKENADSLVLRSCVKVEEIADPTAAVAAMINRVDRTELMRTYRIPEFKAVDEFLGNIARKKGLLKSGGITNLDQAARVVIRDYLNGKIKYFTIPPNAGQALSDDEEMD